MKTVIYYLEGERPSFLDKEIYTIEIDSFEDSQGSIGHKVIVRDGEKRGIISYLESPLGLEIEEDSHRDQVARFFSQA